MSKTRTNSILIIVLLCLIATFIPATFAAPVDTTELGGWNMRDITVFNELNDFEFTIESYYKFDKELASFEFRVYPEEISKNIHYLALNSYEFVGFKGWSVDPEQQFYTANFRVINNASMTIEYKAKSFSVKFVDSITNTIISDNRVSSGGAIIPPTPSNYLDSKGLIFTGWSSDMYEDVEQDITIYTNYAPARFIYLTMPNGEVEKFAVEFGATVKDIEFPDYKDKPIKKLRHLESNENVNENTIIMYDAEYLALYSGFVFPNWLRVTLISIASILAAVAILALPIAIIKRKEKKGNL